MKARVLETVRSLTGAHGKTTDWEVAARLGLTVNDVGPSLFELADEGLLRRDDGYWSLVP